MSGLGTSGLEGGTPLLRPLWPSSNWRRASKRRRSRDLYLKTEREAHLERIEELHEQALALERTVHQMMSTRAWRLMSRYWAMRDGLRGRLRLSGKGTDKDCSATLDAALRKAPVVQCPVSTEKPNRFLTCGSMRSFE